MAGGQDHGTSIASRCIGIGSASQDRRASHPVKRLFLYFFAGLWLAIHFQSLRSAEPQVDTQPRFQSSPLKPLNPPHGTPGFTIISTNSSGLSFSNTIRD